LDALGLDDDPIGEGETPAYLQDAQALPDFVDAAPVEEERAATPTAEVAR
jgi:charged multivesicular body protein 5